MRRGRAEKTTAGIRALAAAAVLLVAAEARGVMVNYTATLDTSKDNPVTHVLILEADGVHPVQAFVYSSEITGHGTAVISHDAPFLPTRSLVIGLTEGVDIDGSDKTQLVMLLDPGFAAANAGVPFSSVFPGARHSETIAHLLAAVAGDAAELAWFTDTFFDGPAAGAAFASAGEFVVAEFTNLDIIGKKATAGKWMILTFDLFPEDNPNAQSGKFTAEIEETAKGDPGPFDIELEVQQAGTFAVDKIVANDTGLSWRQFVMQLGTGVGPAFVPSTAGDGVGFDDSQNNREETGAFPDLAIEEDRIVFSGFLPAGGTARFVVFVRRDSTLLGTITIRQVAVGAVSPAPALGSFSLALLAVLLAGMAAFRLRRSAPAG